MRRMYLFIMLLGITLAACGSPATPTPTATTTPIPPTATLPPLPTSPVTNPTQPGGVEVALSLATIPDKEAIAIVGSETISITAYVQELTRALYIVTNQYEVDWNDPTNQTFLPTLQQQVLDQLIDRAVLRQIAAQENISVDPKDIEDEVTALQGRVQESGQFADWATFLKENGMTEEALRTVIADDLLLQALNERHTAPTTAEQVHASHILVETQETGQEVLDKLAKGEAFADLAAEYSIDTGSKDQGGDLGWFPRGVMVPEFEQAAFSLEPGKISELVQTDFGYHIIQVQEKELREIEPALYEQIRQQAFQEWFDSQRATIDIKPLYVFEAQQ